MKYVTSENQAPRDPGKGTVALTFFALSQIAREPAEVRYVNEDIDGPEAFAWHSPRGIPDTVELKHLVN